MTKHLALRFFPQGKGEVTRGAKAQMAAIEASSRVLCLGICPAHLLLLFGSGAHVVSPVFLVLTFGAPLIVYLAARLLRRVY